MSILKFLKFCALGASMIVGLTFSSECVYAAAARSPGSVLAQLGVNGVTDQIYGTNAQLYANYLIKTDTNGVINVTMLPASVTPTVWNNMIFIDCVNGSDDTNFNGTVSSPYATLTNAIVHAEDNAVFVLAPGTYPAATILDGRYTNLTLIGQSPETTWINGTLRFNNTNNIAVNIYGIKVDELNQNDYRTFTIGLFNRAYVNGPISRIGTNTLCALTVYRDPSAVLTTALPSVTTTDVLTHNATNMSYTAADTNKWWPTLYGAVPLTVGQALNRIVERPLVMPGTNAGEMVTWDGTKWATVTEGTATQVLIGGTSPSFVDYFPMPAGTNSGQIAYWNGSAWTIVTNGATNQILYGGPVPVFDDPALFFNTNNIPYDFVPYADNLYSLGTLALQWESLYVGSNIFIGGTGITEYVQTVMLDAAYKSSNNVFTVTNSFDAELYGTTGIFETVHSTNMTVVTDASSGTQVANYRTVTNLIRTIAPPIDAVAYLASNNVMTGTNTFTKTNTFNSVVMNVPDGRTILGTNMDQTAYNNVIASSAAGASQAGRNNIDSGAGFWSIGANSYGAMQRGWCEGQGYMTIGANAYGSLQLGAVVNYDPLTPEYNTATNLGVGSIQLVNNVSASTMKHALMVGTNSIGLGACTNTHNQAIVAGDDQISHGHQTITAGGGMWTTNAPESDNWVVNYQRMTNYVTTHSPVDVFAHSNNVFTATNTLPYVIGDKSVYGTNILLTAVAPNSYGGVVRGFNNTGVGTPLVTNSPGSTISGYYFDGMNIGTPVINGGWGNMQLGSLIYSPLIYGSLGCIQLDPGSSIITNSVSAIQLGNGCTGTNNAGYSSIQLYSGNGAYMSGVASLGLGVCSVTHDRSIVVGNGQTSPEAESIRSGSGGFWVGDCYFKTNADGWVVNTNLIPSVADSFDLGSPTVPWRSLYISGGTIYMDNEAVLSYSNGQLVVEVPMTNYGTIVYSPTGSFEVITLGGTAIQDLIFNKATNADIAVTANSVTGDVVATSMTLNGTNMQPWMISNANTQNQVLVTDGSDTNIISWTNRLNLAGLTMVGGAIDGGQNAGTNFSYLTTTGNIGGRVVAPQASVEGLGIMRVTSNSWMSPTSGVGLELHATGSGSIFAYDRTASRYLAMNISGAAVTLNSTTNPAGVPAPILWQDTGTHVSVTNLDIYGNTDLKGNTVSNGNYGGNGAGLTNLNISSWPCNWATSFDATNNAGIDTNTVITTSQAIDISVYTNQDGSLKVPVGATHIQYYLTGQADAPAKAIYISKNDGLTNIVDFLTTQVAGLEIARQGSMYVGTNRTIYLNVTPYAWSRIRFNILESWK